MASFPCTRGAWVGVARAVDARDAGARDVAVRDGAATDACEEGWIPSGRASDIRRIVASAGPSGKTRAFDARRALAAEPRRNPRQASLALGRESPRSPA